MILNQGQTATALYRLRAFGAVTTRYSQDRQVRYNGRAVISAECNTVKPIPKLYHTPLLDPAPMGWVGSCRLAMQTSGRFNVLDLCALFILPPSPPNNP